MQYTNCSVAQMSERERKTQHDVAVAAAVAAQVPIAIFFFFQPRFPPAVVVVYFPLA